MPGVGGGGSEEPPGKELYIRRGNWHPLPSHYHWCEESAPGLGDRGWAAGTVLLRPELWKEGGSVGLYRRPQQAQLPSWGGPRQMLFPGVLGALLHPGPWRGSQRDSLEHHSCRVASRGQHPTSPGNCRRGTALLDPVEAPGTPVPEKWGC